MNRLGRMMHVAGVNALAISGLLFGGWGGGTAVAVYWCESLIFVLSVSILVMSHKRITNKSGHYFRRGTYNRSFLITSFVCALLQIPLLLPLLGATDGIGDLRALATGVGAAAVFVLIGFVSSLPGLGERPFAWVKRTTDFALWRIFVTFIAVFIGGFGAIVLNRPMTIVYAFTALRIFTDILLLFPEYNPAEPPRWVTMFGDRAAEDWRKKSAHERSFAAENELQLPR